MDTDLVVDFPDEVLVRRGVVYTEARLDTQHGILFGDWYVIECLGFESAERDPERNFDVGHNPTGLRLEIAGGLTLWEARRVAMAMDDAGIEISVVDGTKPAINASGYLIEAIVASALMDHYVFSLDRWLDATHVDPDHSHGINMHMTRTSDLGHN